MNIRSICLAILYFGDATGYEIKKESTEGKFSHFVFASFGSIYPALARLETDGMVTVREEIHPGKPARKIYSITPAGRADFLSALSEPQAPDLFRSPFLLIAVCAELVTPERMRSAIDLHLDQIRQELAQLSEIAEECGNDATRWAVNYGLHCKTQKLVYLENNRDRLEAISADAASVREAAE